MHKYGGENLTLRPPSEDSTQGARPLGTIALSIAAAYFAVVALGLVAAVLSSFDIQGELLIGALTIFGVAMFFLPLNSIHRRMKENKARELGAVHAQLADLAEQARTRGSVDAVGAPLRIERLMGVQILDRQVASAHTWPFDTNILGKFIAVVLSVTAILLSTVVRDLFHF